MEAGAAKRLFIRKQIARGQTVTIRVRKTDGTLSEGYTFTRNLD